LGLAENTNAYTFWHKYTNTCTEKFKTKLQGDTKKNVKFEKPNKKWRNATKKFYWQKLNHYNLPF